MKFLLLLQTVLAVALPNVTYAYIPEPVGFYAFDGVDYTCLFILPETYFVAVEDEGNDYTAVTYLDMSGYVKRGDVEKVDYEPVTKYATSGKVALKSGIASIYLYADENCTNVLTPVSSTDSLFLYGKAAIAGVYYCRLKGANGTLRGYIGSEGVTVTLPEENDVQAVAPEEPPPDNDDIIVPPKEDDAYGTLSLPVEIILVVSLAVPAFLLVFILTRSKDKPKKDGK